MIRNQIVNGKGNGEFEAEVTSEHALKVAVTDYERLLSSLNFFQNTIHGVDINKNFSDTAAGNAWGG